MGKTKSQVLNDLFKKCNLTSEDVHKHKFYTIITRTGIEKVQAAYGIDVTFDIVKLSDDHKHCLIKAIGIMGESRTETYGECAPGNNNAMMNAVKSDPQRVLDALDKYDLTDEQHDSITAAAQAAI